jgi:hypothetical protein
VRRACLHGSNAVRSAIKQGDDNNPVTNQAFKSMQASSVMAGVMAAAEAAEG